MPAITPAFDKECFFIAPIGAEDSPERVRSDGVLNFIVAKAANEVGLEAIRADKLAEPGLITLQVVQHLLHARAAVADLTGRNANVYYELAVRHTAKLPTVLIAEKGEELPFDIAQMRTIFFLHTDLASADDCRAQLVDQLQEALKGAVDSPITTALDIQTLQAGSVVERNVAELVTDVSAIGRALSELESLVRQARYTSTPGILNRALDDVVAAFAELRMYGAFISDDVGNDSVLDLVKRLEDPLYFVLRELGHDGRPARRGGLPPRVPYRKSSTTEAGAERPQESPESP